MAGRPGQDPAASSGDEAAGAADKPGDMPGADSNRNLSHGAPPTMPGMRETQSDI